MPLHKLLPTLFMLTGCVTATPSDQNDCSHDAEAFRCVQYLRNYDADTITVSIPGVHPLIGKEISIRVAGIDTPEMRGNGRCEKRTAKVARDEVANLLRRATRIDLLDLERDKYFRILAKVIVDGSNLSEVLLRRGLAVPYDGGKKTPHDWCQAPNTVAEPKEKAP